MTDIEKAAREYAGGVQIGMTDSQHDRFVGFLAGAKYYENKFKRDLMKLEALEQSGVHNWEGYHDAIDLLKDWMSND